MPWTPARRHDPELMDEPGLPPAEVAEAYSVLRRINRQLGNRATILREVSRFAAEEVPRSPGRPLTILDVGSGSGDLPEAIQVDLARDSVDARVVAIDHDPVAARESARLGLLSTRGDALRLPFADASIDLVTAVKFVHHFSGTALSSLVAEMARVARRRVVILDIRRDWLAYWGFVAWSRAFTTNRLVRYDGPLSVLRGFTTAELLDLSRPLAHFSWSVTRRAGFQIVLHGRRIATPA